MADLNDPAYLLKIVVDQSAELIAMDVLLRAMIVSHPKPGNLKVALEILTENIADAVREVGFEKGREPKLAQATTADIKKHIDRWLTVLATVPATDLKGRKE